MIIQKAILNRHHIPFLSCYHNSFNEIIYTFDTSQKELFNANEEGDEYDLGKFSRKYKVCNFNASRYNVTDRLKFIKASDSDYIARDTSYAYGYLINPYKTNVLPNTLLASTGVGVDLVAYYDQVFRFEYSINRFKQHGFFIHVKKAF